MNQPKTFVLTGGPQSGKSTIFQLIQYLFPGAVLVYPEVATILLGHLWPTVNPTAPYHATWVKSLQRGVLNTQLGLEELAHAVANHEGQELIGYDRGVLDNAAYLGETGRSFARLMNESWSDFIGRYDMVVHLETIARVHPEEFGSATNETRYETATQAVKLDELIWQAYDGHPNHIRIPATNDFDTKCNHVLELIAELCPTLTASLT